jgi:diamine N-acetyltransferase
LTVELRDIDKDNWQKCIRLRVKTEQEGFVASNAYSLCQAHYETGWRAQAVYEGDVMVGFVMFGDVRHPDWGYWIVRIMIDKTHQGRGLGRSALEAVIDRMRAKDDCEEIFISHEPENTVAEKLYASLGFEKTGAMVEGEIVQILKVR